MMRTNLLDITGTNPRWLFFTERPSFATALAALSLSLGLRSPAGAGNPLPLQRSFRARPHSPEKTSRGCPTAYPHWSPKFRFGGASSWRSYQPYRRIRAPVFERFCPKLFDRAGKLTRWFACVRYPIEVVALAKKWHQRMSLRKISAAIAAQGHVTASG